MKAFSTFKGLSFLWLLNAAFFICSFFAQDLSLSDNNYTAFNQNFSQVCLAGSLKTRSQNSVDNFRFLFATATSVCKKLETGSLSKSINTFSYNLEKYGFSIVHGFKKAFIKTNSSRGPPISFS